MGDEKVQPVSNRKRKRGKVGEGVSILLLVFLFIFILRGFILGVPQLIALAKDMLTY